MKRAVYLEIVKKIEKQTEWNFDKCVEGLGVQYPNESIESIRSIVAEQYKKIVKRHFHALKGNRKRFYNEVIDRIQKGENRIIIDIARKRKFSSALIAKFVLEEWLIRQTGETDVEKKAKQLLQNPNLITNGKLGIEVITIK